MKLLKLNFSGIAHYLMPLVVVIGVGAVGTVVFQATHADSDNCTNHLYSSGSSGACVKDIQKILNYEVAGKLNVDGIYGSLTKAAVVKAQGVANISKDGIVGPDTWKAMCTSNKLTDNKDAGSMNSNDSVRNAFNNARTAACKPKYNPPVILKNPTGKPVSPPTSGKISCSISGPSSVNAGGSWTPVLTVTSTYNSKKTVSGQFSEGSYTNDGGGAGGAPTVSIAVPANGSATKTGTTLTATSSLAGKGGLAAGFTSADGTVKCNKKVPVKSGTVSTPPSSSLTATLSCSNWSFTPSKPQLGKTFKASATIKNTGNAPFATAFMIAFAASPDGSQHNNVADSTDFGTLNPGKSRITSVTLTVPSKASNAQKVYVGFNTSESPSSKIQQKSDNSCVSKVFTVN